MMAHHCVMHTGRQWLLSVAEVVMVALCNRADQPISSPDEMIIECSPFLLQWDWCYKWFCTVWTCW